MASAILLEPSRILPRSVFLRGGLALLALMALVVAIVGPDKLLAQIEGDRGIAPIASSSDIHVTGIEVNTRGDNAQEAREAGWKEAQRKAWAKIGGPKMSDGQLDAMVVAIVIEREQIGPRRYVATLGVIFDRARASQFVGSAGGGARASAPMLVIPVLNSGGVRQVFEVRGDWQRAWANFQTAGSPIEYVRPTGAGGESLILTAGQTERRSRAWWRTLLNQFEAADVLIPVARLERQWPGGPVRGTFTARYGPDNTYLDSFTLTTNSESGVPRMLADAVIKTDAIYRKALADGLLRPDSTLTEGDRAFDAVLAKLRAQLTAAAGPDDGDQSGADGADAGPGDAPNAAPTISTFTVQFASPDAAAVDAAMAAVRGVPGVQGAGTTSLAIGGTSVMRVTIAGNLNSLASALRSQGWNVTVGTNALRISR